LFCPWHYAVVTLWGIYSDVYSEVNLGGDVVGLRQLAEAIVNARTDDLVLANAPPGWLEGTRPLDGLPLSPTADSTDRIRFSRDGSILLITGQQSELGRILAGPIAELAGAKPRPGRHIHFDPTSDPDKRWYAPDSISIVVSREAAPNGQGA
jgi:hypothetical protein